MPKPDRTAETATRIRGLLASPHWISIAAASAQALVSEAFVASAEATQQILLIRADGHDYIAADQFIPGTRSVHPIVPQVLAILPRDPTGWTQALWFFHGNTALSGATPASMLTYSPQTVLAAASRDASTVVNAW